MKMTRLGRTTAVLLAVTLMMSTTTASAMTSVDRLWGQWGPVVGSVEQGDRFGEAVATGDFDGDGYDDAAIGAPGEGIGSIQNAGVVNILYGSATGLTSSGNQAFHQNTPGVAGIAETNDEFGSALATGDFNNDGYDDLAIGVPREDLGSTFEAGMVHILFGSAAGLTAAGDQYVTQGTAGVYGIVEASDWFGFSLATGDVNDDGHDDLVVGSPLEDHGSVANSGMAHYFPGSASGLDFANDVIMHQNSNGIETTPATNDRMGYAVAVADFSGNGYDDIAVSIPWEAVDSGDGPWPNMGIVMMIPGGIFGPIVNDPDPQRLDGVPYSYWSPLDREFGQALGVVHKPTGADRLVVSTNAGSEDSGGGVEVFSFSGALTWTLADYELGYDPALEPGFSVAGQVDLHASNETSGAIFSIPLTTAGGSIDGWLPGALYDQNDTTGTAETGDGFGTDIAIGDFDNDGIDDLLVGTPLEDVGLVTDAGAIAVAYGVNNAPLWN